MDSKTIFVKTGKGEDEVRNKSVYLVGDIKRALLMVDGTATLGEISKRAAPSLRSVLDEMLRELEKGGFVQDKAKSGNILRIVVPPRMATSPKKPADEGVNELDFTAAFFAPSADTLAAEANKAEIAKLKMAAEAKARAEAEAKAEQAIEAAKLKAQQEVEAARHKAEQEVARVRVELEAAMKAKIEVEAKVRALAEAKARQQAEAARIKAEVEAKTRAEVKARQEIEAAKLKAQREAEEVRLKAEWEAAKAREEAERRAKEEAEAARVKAEQDAERVRTEAEARAKQEIKAAKLKAQQEAEETRLNAKREVAKAREEAELVRQQAEAKVCEEAELRAKREAEAILLKTEDAAKPKTGAVATARSTSATVLFFDVVGYTKQPVNKQIEIKKQFNRLVTECLGAQGDGERIILDTGDGAAIGFLQHPEDALEVAMQFRKTVMANQHKDYLYLNVRIGIHLGPINVANDMNGRSNMVGDGINDAQRVMSFAGIDQIYISRAYYDFVSRLSDEYANLFQYRGSQKDKHGREHPVYELMDAVTPVAEAVLQQAGEPAVAIKLEPFSFAIPETVISPASAVVHEEPRPQQQDVAALMGGIEQFKFLEGAEKPVEVAQVMQQQPPSTSVPEAPHPGTPRSTMPSPETQVKPVAEVRMPSAEEVAKLAETQAKAWAEAERRSAEAAKDRDNASAERAARQLHEDRGQRTENRKSSLISRLPWGKIGAGLFVLLLIALFAVPYVLPMKDHATSIEQLLTARLQQPVHVGHLAGRLLPTPRLELKDVSIGETRPIQARQARIDFALFALFSSGKPITGIELEGVLVNGAALPQIFAWLQKIAADTQYPVTRIGLTQGKLESGDVQLSGIGGELSFNQAGKFMQAKLHAEGNKIALNINATPENKMQVSITVRDSALPLLPNWVFDELNAKGELTNDELIISDLDGRVMGGVLLGDARIDWRSGWRAQGGLTAKTITLQNMSNALSGDMDGTARFQMQSATLSRLTEEATLEGVFVVKKGVINGIDVVETARLRSRENLPGGRTHFDELSGDLYYANGDYHFRQVKMSAGVLNATGTLDIARQQVSGRVIADLTMRAGMGSVALQVGGTTDNPSLQAVR